MSPQTDVATILVVDDTPSNLAVMRDLLEGAGYRVAIAQDGEEGLLRVKWARPDLILLDVMLPGMDGFQICECLKAEETTRDIPVIFMTALAATDQKIKGFNVGGVDYLTKPLQTDEVLARVGTHLNLRMAQRRLAAQNEELERHRAELELRVAERTAELAASNASLSESRQRYLDIFENVSDGLYLLEVLPDGRFRSVEMNPALERSTGMRREMVIGKCVDETVSGDTARSVTEKYRRCVSAGTPIDEEIELDLPVGRRTYHSTLIPIRDAGGRVCRIAGISRDITDRKRTELLLQQQLELEMQFHTLAESAPDCISRYDRQCRLVYMNSLLAEMFRASGIDAMGKAPTDMRRDDQSEAFEALLAKVIATGKPGEMEMMMPDASGSLRWHHLRMVAERGAQAEITGVLAIGRDITDLKALEAALRASMLEFRSLAENIPDVVTRYDTQLQRIYANPAFERITGTPALLGMVAETHWMSDMPLEEYRAKLRGVIETGEPCEFIFGWPQLEDGSMASFTVRIVAERNSEGEIIGVLAIAHNVTALVEAERSLLESRSQLRSLATRREAAREDERRRIARELHDELGQQLTALRFAVTMLDFKFGTGRPEVQGALADLLTLVEKTIQTTRDVSFSLRPAALNMGIVPALEWLVEESSRRTGIAFELKAPQDVRMDEQHAVIAFRIVQESLTNAIRHSKADRVQVILTEEGDSFVVEVRDNGIGFDTEAPSRQRSFGIVGIRERALAVGGEAVISSSPGWGTVVRVRIPASNTMEDQT